MKVEEEMWGRPDAAETWDRPAPHVEPDQESALALGASDCTARVRASRKWSDLVHDPLPQTTANKLQLTCLL